MINAKKLKWTNLSALLCILIMGIYSQSLKAHEHQSMVFEMRTYTTFEGKLEALNTRFRDHTLKLFEQHGMKNIGYWIPTEKPNTLIYIVAHKSKATAAESWSNFVKDTAWKKAYADSIVEGKLVANIDSVFMSPTDYSSIQ